MPTRSAPKDETLLLVSLSLALVLCSSTPSGICKAQTSSGTLFGRVRDRLDKPLDEVHIQLVNEETGNEENGETNGDGYFTIPNIRPGTYRIIASKDGFIDFKKDNFLIHMTVKSVVKLPEIKLQQATVKGRITDRAGNGLRGAKVIVSGLRRGAVGAAVTDDLGDYAITDLPPGPYVITAEWKDETNHGLTSIRLSLDREEVSAPPVRLLSVLRPSAGPRPTPAAPASDGSKAAALVQGIDAARISNFSRQQLDSLPVGAAVPMRSFDELALLVPGVAPPPFTPGVRGPGVGFGVGAAGQFSVNGMRARSNNFSVDGSDNNDPDVGVRRQGFVALVPQPLETVRDFSVATLLWDAELGRNFGGQVNAVSDYGGNRYRGQLYAFFTDSSLNARNFFDYRGGPSGGEDPFTRTHAGFNFGGPLRRNRTHFFTSLEHNQVNASTEQHFSTPALAERSFLGGQEFRTHIIEDASFGTWPHATPLGARTLSFYPPPNNPGGPYGANTFSKVLPADGRGDVASLMLSHQVTPDNLLGARYSFAADRRVLPSVNRAINSTLDSRARSQNLSLVLDSTLGPKLYNQARFSFGRTRLNFIEYPGSPFIFQSSGEEMAQIIFGDEVESFSVVSRTGPIGELVVEPFSPVGVGAYDFPQRRVSNTFQFADSLTAVAGRHSIKFGGNVRRYQLNSVSDRLYRPRLVFSGQVLTSVSLIPDSGGVQIREELITGVRQASLGRPSSIMQTITRGAPDSTIGLRFTEYHAFVNDNWRVHPRFTIDLGLRYEYNTVPSEVNNRIEDSLRLSNLPRPGSSIFDNPDSIAAFDAAVDAYRQVLGGRTRIYDPDRNNFGPRAGFAWSLDSDGRAMLRAGYGVYFDTILGAVVSQSRNVFPNEIPINTDPEVFFGVLDPFELIQLSLIGFRIQDEEGRFSPVTFVVRQTPCNSFGTCNQFGGTPGDFVPLVGEIFRLNRTGGLAFTLPEKRLRTPYAQQWHLTFERELPGDFSLSAAYVGTKGTKLTRLTTPNLGPNVTPHDQVNRVFAPQVVPVVRQRAIGAFICPPEGAPCGNSFFNRPNRALGPYQIFENSAGSNYHGLQIEARNRYTRGYQFTAAYTWSHAIDDVSDLFPVSGAPVLAQDSFNLRAERADANFDVRHRFAASLVWDLPFYREAGRVAKFLLGDWQVASVFQAHTGQPFTLGVPFDANVDGNLSDRPATTDGLVFFNGHGPRRIGLAPGRLLTDFLPRPVVVEDSEFRFISELEFESGRVGRNTARADSFVNLDLALSKRFRVTESQHLTLRAEIFNALNRANFGSPVRIIGAPGFGSAVDTVTPARIIQFALKYDF